MVEWGEYQIDPGPKRWIGKVVRPPQPTETPGGIALPETSGGLKGPRDTKIVETLATGDGVNWSRGKLVMVAKNAGFILDLGNPSEEIRLYNHDDRLATLRKTKP